MRKVIVFILSLVILASSLGFIVAYVSDDVINKRLTDSMIDQLDIRDKIAEDISDITTNKDFKNFSSYGILESDYKVQLDSMADDIKKSKKLQNILGAYTKNFIYDISKKSGYSKTDIDKKVHAYLSTYGDKIKALFNKQLISQVNSIIGTNYDSDKTVDLLLNKIDGQEIYEQAVDKGRSELGDKQIVILHFVLFMSDAAIQSYFMIACGSAALLIILINRKNLRFFVPVGLPFIISGSLILGSIFLLKARLMTVASNYGDTMVDVAGKELDVTCDTGKFYLLAGFIIVAVGIISYQMHQRKETENKKV